MNYKEESAGTHAMRWWYWFFAPFLPALWLLSPELRRSLRTGANAGRVFRAQGAGRHREAAELALHLVEASSGSMDIPWFHLRVAVDSIETLDDRDLEDRFLRLVDTLPREANDYSVAMGLSFAARVRWRRGERAEAFELAKSAIAADATTAYPVLLLAWYTRHLHGGDAMPLLERAVRLDPRQADQAIIDFKLDDADATRLRRAALEGPS